jgi:hypothetical protein
MSNFVCLMSTFQGAQGALRFSEDAHPNLLEKPKMFKMGEASTTSWVLKLGCVCSASNPLSLLFMPDHG